MDVFNLTRFGWPKRWSESESMIAPWQELEPLSTDAHPRDVPASLWRKPLDERMGVALRGWKSKGISLWINFFTAFLRFLLVTASTLMIVWELALRWLDCLRWKHLWFNALLLAAWQKLSCASEVDIDFIWFYHIPWRYRTVDTDLWCFRLLMLRHAEPQNSQPTACSRRPFRIWDIQTHNKKTNAFAMWNTPKPQS